MNRYSCEKLCDAYGVNLYYDRGIPGSNPWPWHIELEAPPGKAFKSSSCRVDCSLRGEDDDGNVTQFVPHWHSVYGEIKAILEQGFTEDPEWDEDE